MSCLIGLALVLASMAHADLLLPGVIADHMVLQQQSANPIWGWDNPGTTVTVTFAGQSYAAVAGADGRWAVALAPLPANATPQTLTVTGSSTRAVQDILIGEVWLCSGQSNMELGVGVAQNGPKEIAHANYPDIRLLMVSQPLDAAAANEHAREPGKSARPRPSPKAAGVAFRPPPIFLDANSTPNSACPWA